MGGDGGGGGRGASDHIYIYIYIYIYEVPAVCGRGRVGLRCFWPGLPEVNVIAAYRHVASILKQARSLLMFIITGNGLVNPLAYF